MRRAVQVSLCVLLALVLCIALAYVLLFWTAWGRDVVRARICQAVNSQIQGKLEIERVSEIDLPRLRAHGVKIVSPRGQAVIDVAHATIDFDIGSLLGGDFIWHRAEISDGVVRVMEDAQERLHIEDAFKARKPKPKPKRDGEEREDESTLDLRTMNTSNMVLLIDGGSLPKLKLVDLHGVMRVHVPAAGPVTLRFDDYRGTFREGLPHGVLKFRDVKGQVTPDYRRLLRFEGQGSFEGEAVAFTLAIQREPKKSVTIRAHFPKLSATSVATLGLEKWSKLTPSLRLDVTHGQ